MVKFIGAEHQHQPDGICYSFIDYLDLADWTGRVIREDKRGAITENLPSLLSDLGLEQAVWLEMALSFGQNYHCAVGTIDELRNFAGHTGRRWVSRQEYCRRVFL